ncbi:hypothetical protein VTN77DRAFT_3293 [Rasamsonia byssochlamydoides]|uniref:uncharacterized protein n=1 Tax=Rasamsonia byssochlamydoides TaxID=89139 RepID=UPI00374300C3
MSSGTAGPYQQRAIKTEWEDPSTLNTFPKGLRNNSEETCYRNAALVLFFHTPALLNWAADFVARYCGNDPSQKDDVPCVICLFHRLAEAFWSPNAVLRQDDTAFMQRVELLWQFTAPEDWKQGEQQDVREYMECVLQSFQQEATNRGAVPILPTFTSVVHTRFVCEGCQSVDFSSKPDDLLFLGGQLSDTGVKDQREKKQETPMCPMDSVINSYVRPQRHSGKPCLNCEKDKDMLEWTSILAAPNILLINVNRHGVNGKVTTPVKIQMGMELHSLCQEPNGLDLCNLYEMYGVLFHIGDINSGHYIAVVKGPVGGWMLFDDENRQHIAAERIEELQNELTTSYVFAYRKVGRHPLPELDMQAPGNKPALGYEQEHRVGELQSSHEIVQNQNPTESVPGTRVWLEGTIKIDERDLEGRITQQLFLRSELGPLVKQTKTRSKVQPVVFLITLRADDSSVVLEGILKGNVKPKKETAVQERDTSSKKPAETQQPASGTRKSARLKKREKAPQQSESRDETSTAQEARQGTENSTATSKPAAVSRKRKKGPENPQNGGETSTVKQARSGTEESRGASRSAAVATSRKRKKSPQSQQPENGVEASSCGQKDQDNNKDSENGISGKITKARLNKMTGISVDV